MKKKPYYLKKYHEWMKRGALPQVSTYFNGGLCGAGLAKNIELFRPEYEERNAEDSSMTSFWADGFDTQSYRRLRDFTPLRQTIVLFLAAMNDEL